jgi:hypothetical protein
MVDVSSSPQWKKMQRGNALMYIGPPHDWRERLVSDPFKMAALATDPRPMRTQKYCAKCGIEYANYAFAGGEIDGIVMINPDFMKGCA